METRRGNAILRASRIAARWIRAELEQVGLDDETELTLRELADDLENLQLGVRL